MTKLELQSMIEFKKKDIEVINEGVRINREQADRVIADINQEIERLVIELNAVPEEAEAEVKRIEDLVSAEVIAEPIVEVVSAPVVELMEEKPETTVEEV